MNVVLDRIERELTASIGRRHARRRRRRTLASVVGATLVALALAGAGVAAVSDSPLDRLLGSDTPLAERPATGDGARLELSLADADGLRWTVAAYPTVDGLVGSTAVPDGLREALPAGGAASGFVLADDLLDDALASNSFELVRSDADGRVHYLLSGLVDARVRRVTVATGDEQLDAHLSAGTISAPVEIPTGDLTEAGRARASRLPPEVTVRAFAATPAPDSLAARDVVQLTLTLTLADGSVQIARTARCCVASSCGVLPPHID